MDERQPVPPCEGGAPVDAAGSAPAGAPQPVIVRVEQPEAPRGLRGLMIALIVLLSLVLLTLGSCVFVGGTAVKGFADFMSAPTDGSDAGLLAMDGIGVYHLDEQIGSGGIGAEEVRQVLRDAEDDPTIKAVVLRVESPGGEAAAGSEIASYVEEFSKPLVVSAGNMCASAAYLAASQADWIVATDASEVGSIGTIVEVSNLEGLFDKLGISTETIKSSSMKDMGSSSRPLTDEERALLQEKVDRATQTFIEKVAQGRGTDVDTVRGWANGTTYFGTDALDRGLVDQIGTLDDALDKAAELGGLQDGDYDVRDIDPEAGLLDDLGLGDLLG